MPRNFLISQLFISLPIPTSPLPDQVIIVTGSNTGLGKEAARHFAKLGPAKVILAVRNLEAGEAAKKDIETTTKCPKDCVEVWKLDLSDYASVKAFAEKANKELKRVDVLLENAGLAAGEKWITANGHERGITVNVISTIYLALLMLPKMKATAKEFSVNPRLTIVTSEVHSWTKFDVRKETEIFKTLATEKWFRAHNDYYQVSKLLEVFAVREMAPLMENSGVVLNMLNPGLCHSELSRDGPWILEVLKFLLARSTEKGSRTLLASATAGKESHGKYMTDAEVDDAALSAFVRSKEGEETQKRVWGELKGILEGEVEEGVLKNLEG